MNDRYVPLQERLDFCALVSERARLWDVDTTWGGTVLAPDACWPPVFKRVYKKLHVNQREAIHENFDRDLKH